MFRFDPEAGLIALTLANGVELFYQRPTRSQFSPEIVTSELLFEGLPDRSVAIQNNANMGYTTFRLKHYPLFVDLTLLWFSIL